MIILVIINQPQTKNTQAGGFLELRFVRLQRGVGVVRDRYGAELLHDTPLAKVNSLDRGWVFFLFFLGNFLPAGS